MHQVIRKSPYHLVHWLYVHLKEIRQSLPCFLVKRWSSSKNLEVAHLFLHKLSYLFRNTSKTCWISIVKVYNVTYPVHMHVIMPLCLYTASDVFCYMHQIAEKLVRSTCVTQGILDYCFKTGSMKNLSHTGQSGCSTAWYNQYLFRCSMRDRRAKVPQLKIRIMAS